MANDEHLQLLADWQRSWNTWRRDNPDVRPDLSGADLTDDSLHLSFDMDFRHADLRNANISGLTLMGADFRDADLSAANAKGTQFVECKFEKARFGTPATVREPFIGEYIYPSTTMHRPSIVVEAQQPAATLEEAIFSRCTLQHAVLDCANLRETTFYSTNLADASLIGTDLYSAMFHDSNATRCNLRRANLTHANLHNLDLTNADLRDASLVGTRIGGTSILVMRNMVVGPGGRVKSVESESSVRQGACLRGATLRGADLTTACLVDADLSQTDLTGAHVYGAAVWGTKVDEAIQTGLVISPHGAPLITVDDLAVAQLVYLISDNAHLRRVFDTLASKTVLILGRFSERQKPILDSLRPTLAAMDLVPIMFDFTPSSHIDETSTVLILASLARFIIADLSESRSVPHELATIIKEAPVPLLPIIRSDETPYAMFENLQRRYHWVLELFKYTNQDELAAAMPALIRKATDARKDLLQRTEPSP